jgi:hypothetical protein
MKWVRLILALAFSVLLVVPATAADSYTSSLRLVQMTTGSNDSTWGTKANAAWAMLDEAVAGYSSVSVTAGNVTLTTANNATDQSRKSVLVFAGTPGTTRTVTAPDVSKITWVQNDSDSTITYKTGAGTTVSIPSGNRALVRTDGATNAVALVNISTFGASLIDDADASTSRTTLGLSIGTNVQAWDADLDALAGLTTGADTLPYFTGSHTASLANFTSFGRSLVDDADAATSRTTLGLVIGTNVQAYDADLAAIAGLTSAADQLPYATGTNTWAMATFTSTGRSIVSAASTSAVRSTLGLVIGTNVEAWDADLDAIAALSSAADQVPYSTGAQTWALTSFTSTGRSIVGGASTAAVRSTLGLVIGTNVQAWDADLDAIAALSSAADKLPYSTGAQTWSLASFTSFGRTMVSAADAATERTNLGLVIGTNVEAWDADLDALAGLTSAADKLPYFTGSGTAAVTGFSSFMRTLLDDADAATARTTLGVSTGPVALAYVHFSVSGTTPSIQDSSNTTSVTRNSAGNYTVTFTTGSGRFAACTATDGTSALICAPLTTITGNSGFTVRTINNGGSSTEATQVIVVEY